MQHTLFHTFIGLGRGAPSALADRPFELMDLVPLVY